MAKGKSIRQGLLGLGLLQVAFSSCLPRVSSSSSGTIPIPVCAGSRAAPVVLAETLPFCGYTGLSCCDPADDAALRDDFESFNVSPDAGCTDIVRRILCEGCIPASSSLPPPPDPFMAAAPTTAESRIPPRCTSPPASSTSAAASSPQEGAGTSTMCLESIGGVRGSSYHNMAAHPDGSNRAFFSTQDGKIWLASIPAPGSGDTLEFHDSSPFLGLTGRVVGLMGIAFHPQFADNGRFFVSYTCDTAASPACSGSSAAATRTDSSSSPSSQYQLIVAEFSVANKSKAIASEVRRLFTLGLPYTASSDDQQQQHGGQILFRRPSDGYLYLMTGHGDHFDNDTTSFLGKIIRLNIDSTINGKSGGTSASRHSNINRSAAGTSTTAPMEEAEIFAVGLSNPRGCSFDSDRPSYLFCANVDQQQYESVYLIGGPSVNAASLVFGSRAHPVSAGSLPSPSIVGGLVYRGSADPSLKGRYLYMYGFSAWAAVEAPVSSGPYVSIQIPNIRCSPAAVPCIGGRVVVYSFGEDNNKDAFLLATGAVYRVVAPSVCHHAAAPRRWPSGLSWLLSFGSCAIAFAFYQIYMRMFSGGQAAAVTNLNGWFRCFASTVCSCGNTVTTIINGPPPGAGAAEQALQLGA